MVHIKISGPGTAFGFEFQIVKNALEKEGVKVEIENEHPYSDDDYEHSKKLKHNHEVKLIADHCPWGG